MKNPKTHQLTARVGFLNPGSVITRILCHLAVLAVLVPAGRTTASAREGTVIALGKVEFDGTLIAGATDLGPNAAIVSRRDTLTGDYIVDVTAQGAFTDARVSDFVLEGGIVSEIANDDAVKGQITSVTANQLQIAFHTDDMEDISNLSVSESRDLPFFFVVHRITPGEPQNAATRFLMAAGAVESEGQLLQSVAVDGITSNCRRTGTGEYVLTFSREGAFASDGVNDYVIVLTPRELGVSDTLIRGAVTATVGTDDVSVTVHTDDGQSQLDHSGVIPVDSPFYYTVYRITDDGPAKSTLGVAAASIDANGNTVAFGSAVGGQLQSVRTGAGLYEVTLTSPNAFAGRTVLDFMPHAMMNQSINADEKINAFVSQVTPNQLRISVAITDVEVFQSEVGVAQDENFFLTIYSIAGDRQPDLRIGKRNDPEAQVGNDVYNANGRGQQVRLRLPGTKRKKFFFSLENDGNVADDYRLSASRAGKRIRQKIFRTMGGRENITAQIASGGGLSEPDLRPGEIRQFESLTGYRKLDKRPRKTIRFTSRSESRPEETDVNRAKLATKN